MPPEANYNNWTKLGLIQRVKELENELKSRPAAEATATQPLASPSAAATSGAVDGIEPALSQKKPKAKRKMDPSKYSMRYIALKVAYLGKNYGGLEYQALGTLPSIEEELWNALTKACLIFPEDPRVVDFDCCEYSKCGRTDRGVSAFGQVFGLRVRSNRPLPKKRATPDVADAGDGEPDTLSSDHQEDAMAGDLREPKPFDPIADEICYPRALNRLLPSDIRVLAWCPSPPPDFSARFSCRERQYRYFFTQPAFSPEIGVPGGAPGSGWLDIEAMRDAARRYEGEHDFRNLCKLDPSKQIMNFRREIFEASIHEVKDMGSALPYLRYLDHKPAADAADEVYPKVYSFNVRGSAFLWHQIRHMVQVLFLVGQGLEAPTIVDELLDVATNPRKPNYTMADDVPLVLWDCIFPEEGDPQRKDALGWVYVGDDAATSLHGPNGIVDGAWEMWRGKKMDEILANQLLQLISHNGGCGSKEISGPTPPLPQDKVTAAKAAARGARLFEGGNRGRTSGRYIPVMKKDLLQPIQEQNDRFAKRKGYADSDDMRRQKGFRASRDDAPAAAE